MAKRMAQSQRKIFNFDLESLLISDFSLEDSQTFSTESCNHPKKFKTTNSKGIPANKIITTKDQAEDQLKEEEDESEERQDVTEFFKDFGNDFNKSMQLRKSKLGQFTENVISVYQSKFTDLIKKQEMEIQEFKEQNVHNIERELNKCEEDFKKLKLQESKLTKFLEQQLKMVQKTSTIQSEWTENFHKMHSNFVQDFEDLKIRHKNETQELKKIIANDISNLQKRFLIDSKKEEMETMKKYLRSVYF